MTETIELAAIVILGLCSFRITRFIVDDSLWEDTRTRLLSWLIADRRPPLWKAKLFTLLDCYWCVGIWVTLALVCVFYTAWPWQLGIAGWVAVGAIAGFQSLCSTVADRLVEG